MIARIRYWLTRRKFEKAFAYLDTPIQIMAAKHKRSADARAAKSATVHEALWRAVH